MTDRRTKAPISQDDRLLSAWLSEAAEADDAMPEGLPSAAQLLWRAEVLARLEAEERRSRRALMPITVAAAVAVSVLVSLTALIAVGSPLVAGANAWLVGHAGRLLALVCGFAAIELLVLGALGHRPSVDQR